MEESFRTDSLLADASLSSDFISQVVKSNQSENNKIKKNKKCKANSIPFIIALLILIIIAVLLLFYLFTH